ncbi:MAG: PAS domain S-box protein [Melioribacteraceae bacterium]|nr:PAS domain S-box protein [Melioribacteraceae bacterium]MCF8353401.1 PAS domain S-box protein [Melioribacteraceae bacterium]MCF8393020.1 PAS domain S-box protein [Melioribacteraceae bacterium]MCF8419127.1 PAS domain S-box protein [Melioribacteraceae bacterium]
MKNLHSLLKRQLKRHLNDIDEIPSELKNLIEAVNLAYHQFDADRNMLERSLDLSSEELLSANRELEAHRRHLENLVEERTKELRSTNKKLKHEIKERTKVEKIHRGLHKISNAVFEVEGLKDLFKAIHKILSDFIDTSNLFIALYNKEDDTLSLAYYSDSVDKFKKFPAKQTLTSYVIKTNKPQLLSLEQIYKLKDDGIIDLVGTPSKIWLGIPMRVGKEVKGAIVVQSYTDEKAFNESDLQLLSFVSAQIGLSVERKQAEQDLKESENRFKNLAESITDIFFALDKDYKIVYWNKASEFNFNQISKNVLDKTIFDVLPQINTEKICEVFQRVINQQTPHNFVYSDNLKGRKKFLELNVYPAKNGLSIFIKDITKDKLAEHAFKRYTEELEELNANKDKFFSIIAHDLKSPFNSLLGLLDILLEDIDDLEKNEIKEFVQSINHSSRKIFNLIQNLLEWSRIQTNRFEFKPAYHKLVPIINELMELYEPIAREKGITLENQITTDLEVYCDKNMLEVVLRNLTSNAIKYTKRGGNIWLSWEDTNANHIIINVVDNGVGIEKNRIDKLFILGTNTSTQGTNNEEGTGLGLILCKEFIEKNDGEIWFRSDEGEGSMFSFTIPRRNL